MAKNRLTLFLLFCILLHSCHRNIEAAPEQYRVRNLPGFNGTFPSKHYAGYVTLDGNPQKNLFYYFVSSEEKSPYPQNQPVVLWLNGGPGCSSFDGFVYEHGPFNFEASKQQGGLPWLHLNLNSWSKAANVIYLDSPAGTGFSYSPNTTDYVTGDIQTAADTHLFLLKWFEQYPELRENPFYIAGESYAGIYVPTLASEIVRGNNAGNKPAINFKGYMIGNGVCDPFFDGNALVPFAHGMGLISNKLFKEAEDSCKGNYRNWADPKCEESLHKIDLILDGLNFYDTLEPCFHSSTDFSDKNSSSSFLPQSFKELGSKNEKPFPVRKRMFGRAWPFRAPVEDGPVPSWPQLMREVHVPCMDDSLASQWLNDPNVREAIHANEESGRWSLCVGLRYSHDAGSMIGYHKNMSSKGYRILIYSGDHDMCVPFTGTQAWTAAMGFDVVDEWRPWISSNGQIAGYLEQYANDFTFLTVKGAGHTVPEYKPLESLDFFSRWLRGEKI